MKKAKPSPAAYNIIPRLRDLTYAEWRELYAHTFDKVAVDIWKNCKDKGITRTNTWVDEYITSGELEDIRQKLEIHFYEQYLLFKSGSDKRTFPSFPGGFYKWNYYACAEMFLGYMLKGKLRVDSVAHDDMMLRQELYDFFEDWEQRVMDEYESNLCRYFEEAVGVSLDDIFGGIFGFWWMGYSLRDIANLLNIGYKYFGESQRNICHVTIKRKLSNTFMEIEQKLGLTKKDMTEIRDNCIRRNPLAEKLPDPPDKPHRPSDVK